MKKILTAIGNTYLNEKLLNNPKYEVISKDIQYKEGILEILNINDDIDIVIISEILEGEISFKELINTMKQIKENIEIIVFLENENIELRSFLFSKGVYKIYINNEIDIDTFIINLENNTEEKTNELTEEIKKLKEIIRTQQNKYTNEKKEGRIIAIAGAYGCGKSIFSCLLCKEFVKQKRKTLLIDFDIFNSSINVLYNSFKYNQKHNTFDLKEHIVEISKNEHILCAVDLVFSDEKPVDYINLQKMFQEFKNMYDEIIVDTTSNFKYKYLKKLLDSSDYIMYVVVPTISEIKKAVSLYEIFKIDFKISDEKVKFVVNKQNRYSVDELIVAKIFDVKKISAIIKYNDAIEIDINKKSKLKIDLLT